MSTPKRRASRPIIVAAKGKKKKVSNDIPAARSHDEVEGESAPKGRLKTGQRCTGKEKANDLSPGGTTDSPCKPRSVTSSSAARSVPHDTTRAAPRHGACNKTCNALPLYSERSPQAANPEGRPLPRRVAHARGAPAPKPRAMLIRSCPSQGENFPHRRAPPPPRPASETPHHPRPRYAKPAPRSYERPL